MKFAQKRHRNRTAFDFGEHRLTYRVEDGSGSREFSVDYESVEQDRETLIERNDWLGNVGLLWLAIGAAVSVISFTGEKPSLSIWLWLGAACYAVYRFRTTRYVVVPTGKGKLFVIEDAEAPRILDEIKQRRSAALRRNYDGMRPDEAPDTSNRRFRWLHEQGALSDEELSQRMQAVAAMASAGDEATAAPRLLN